MHISERIKQRMTELDIRAVDISKTLKVSKGAVSQWLNGTAKPSGENLFRLSGLLKCSQEWLISGKGEPEAQLVRDTAPGPEFKKKLPLISWVQAGAWSTIVEKHPSQALHYPCPVACSDRSFVLEVQGISMEPQFRNGDLIFVDPESEWRNGSFVVARLDSEDEATFKQLIIEGGHKYLKPLNPNWPEQIIPINGNCTIVGVVVFAGRAF